MERNCGLMLLIWSKFECRRVECIPTYPTLRIKSRVNSCSTSNVQFWIMPGRPKLDARKLADPVPFNSAGSWLFDGGVKLGKPASNDCTGVKLSAESNRGLAVVPLVSDAPKSEYVSGE